jgi:outer membrane lipoprotein-sorting protein
MTSRLLVSLVLLLAQAKPAVPVADIIKKFSENETASQAAWEKSAYREQIVVQEMERSNVRGDYRLVTDLGPLVNGHRSEKIVASDESTLRRVAMTPDDLQDFRDLAFVLTAENIQKYDVKYTGMGKVEDYNCYIFEVKPKKSDRKVHQFRGKIWVEDKGLHIIRTSGKTAPDLDPRVQNLFPSYLIERLPEDDHWFPAEAMADEYLEFRTGKVRIKVTLRFSNYK